MIQPGTLVSFIHGLAAKLGFQTRKTGEFTWQKMEGVYIYMHIRIDLPWFVGSIILLWWPLLNHIHEQQKQQKGATGHVMAREWWLSPITLAWNIMEPQN